MRVLEIPKFRQISPKNTHMPGFLKNSKKPLQAAPIVQPTFIPRQARRRVWWATWREYASSRRPSRVAAHHQQQILNLSGNRAIMASPAISRMFAGRLSGLVVKAAPSTPKFYASEYLDTILVAVYVVAEANSVRACSAIGRDC